MSKDTLEIIETKLLKPYKYPRLVHNGFLYHFHKPCNQHLRWKCNRVYSMRCPAVLRTNIDMLNLEHIAVDHEHVHQNDGVAIFDLKMKIKSLHSSTTFRNNTMFKPKNGYAEINFNEKDIPGNNTMLKPKNSYANININEEKLRILINGNININQLLLVNPLNPDYEHKCTDEFEQIIKNKNLNDKSIDFPNRIARNTSKQISKVKKIKLV